MSTQRPTSGFFERVVVISLARRPQRLAQFRRSFQGWPFKTPELFQAVDGLSVPVPDYWPHGPGAWGCMLSHRAVLASAITDRVSSLLVLEDDAILTPDFAKRAFGFLLNVPDNWDCLMLGAEHLFPPVPVAGGVVRCRGSNRTHAYAVRGRMMSILPKMWHHFRNEHCDMGLALSMPHCFAYAPDPLLIGQEAGFSDITRAYEKRRFLDARQLAAMLASEIAGATDEFDAPLRSRAPAAEVMPDEYAVPV
ncbi:MAG TPA: glycosyltransferase family 25 protein [Tepidisphaeraceae bacterium]|nr:glycosyltransferase family 25 protein [Tepidisphaeraceae bacterium]